MSPRERPQLKILENTPQIPSPQENSVPAHHEKDKIPEITPKQKILIDAGIQCAKDLLDNEYHVPPKLKAAYANFTSVAYANAGLYKRAQAYGNIALEQSKKNQPSQEIHALTYVTPILDSQVFRGDIHTLHETINSLDPELQHDAIMTAFSALGSCGRTHEAVELLSAYDNKQFIWNTLESLAVSNYLAGFDLSPVFERLNLLKEHADPISKKLFDVKFGIISLRTGSENPLEYQRTKAKLHTLEANPLAKDELMDMYFDMARYATRFGFKDDENSFLEKIKQSSNHDRYIDCLATMATEALFSDGDPVVYIRNAQNYLSEHKADYKPDVYNAFEGRIDTASKAFLLLHNPKEFQSTYPVLFSDPTIGSALIQQCIEIGKKRPGFTVSREALLGHLDFLEQSIRNQSREDRKSDLLDQLINCAYLRSQIDLSEKNFFQEAEQLLELSGTPKSVVVFML